MTSGAFYRESVEIDDRHITATPEGVPLEAVLAGLGSRFVAYAFDFALQVAAFVLVAIGLGIGFGGSNASHTSALIVTGSLVLFAFVDYFGYFIFCEMLFNGRSLGKRLAGLRVVRVSGQAVGFWSSLLRNLLRVADALPGMNLVGVVLIVTTTKNQRLGDLVAGTIVVRDRVTAAAAGRDSFASGAHFAAPAWNTTFWAPGAPTAAFLPPELAHWDVSAVPGQELALAHTFLSNRAGYTPEARTRLSTDLANRIWPYVSGPTNPPHPEQFLEMVMLVKTARG
jgi:uncharacterized RDD family membrane protein YckC